jgi:hypothetical protein
MLVAAAAEVRTDGVLQAGSERGVESFQGHCQSAQAL